MAFYQIRTTRTQEVGLKWAFETYGSPSGYTDQTAYFQSRIDLSVTDPMYQDYQRAHTVALDASLDTIPEANQSKAQQEIEQVILENGGTLVPAGPTPAGSLPPPTSSPAPMPMTNQPPMEEVP